MGRAFAELEDVAVARNRRVPIAHDALDIFVAHRVKDHRDAALVDEFEDRLDLVVDCGFAAIASR